MRDSWLVFVVVMSGFPPQRLDVEGSPESPIDSLLRNLDTLIVAKHSKDDAAVPQANPTASSSSKVTKNVFSHCIVFLFQ